jgi:adenosylmethionine-8-amino-7-oxononanoate aminotransferase
MKTAPIPIPIERGEGAWLIDGEGRRYLDAFSSWWVNLHGHAHPHLIERIRQQGGKLEHVVFTDFTHAPAIELAERLLELLPSAYSRVFYSDNGSTAVEAALKMAIQATFNCQSNRRNGMVVSFKGGYHGDTFGAMAAGGKGMFTQPFWPYLFSVEQIEPPLPGRENESMNQLEQLIDDQDVVCFIFEPLIQGVGGMKTHNLEALDRMIALCHEKGVLTIADEVMTGFGRTGPKFVVQKLAHPPSILCLAKGITGGMLPLAATVCQEAVYEAFLSDQKEKAFLHGHSYTANPLACAAALASLELLQLDECQKQRDVIARRHRAFCRQLQGHPRVERCEATGTIFALEYASQHSYFDTFSDRLKAFFLKRNILVRPIGRVLHVMPPYCTKESELDAIYQSIHETLGETV